ncbi:MAG: zeta toxin family protein [Verrucomicrobiota bacterium]
MSPEPAIYVLAGIDGAGKSSIGGANLRSRGLEYYDPDTVSRTLRNMHPNMTHTLADSHAWHLGKDLLENAIETKSTFAFKSTLSGKTISLRLIEAAQSGLKVRVWYMGLESVEMHIDRVKRRVRQGGHNIPKQTLLRRWDQSRRNLIKLIPFIDSLRILDNSQAANPLLGQSPIPRLILYINARKIAAPKDLSRSPNWAKPIVAAALREFEYTPSPV